MNLKYRIRNKQTGHLLWSDFPVDRDGMVLCTCPEDRSSFVIEVWTGLQDRRGREVYEGDRIKFTYYPGDLSWDFISKKKKKENDGLTGREFEGIIVKTLIGNNLEIRVGEPPAPTLFFPLSYISNGELVE